MKTFLTLLTIGAQLVLQAQTLAWTRNLPGKVEKNCASITSDNSYNVLATGYFKDSLDFDPGPGTAFRYTKDHSAYVVKLDPSGNFAWAVSFPPVAPNYGASNGKSVITDVAGNVYLLGDFKGVCDFDPGPGVASFTSYVYPSTPNSFILKLDPNGNFLWAKLCSPDQVISAITTDAAGHLFACGYFTGTGDIDWSPAGSTIVTAVGQGDGFISELDGAGNFIRYWQVGGTGAFNFFYAVSKDKASNLYACGSFWGSIDADPGPGVHLLSANQQGMLIKLDPAGNFLSAYAGDNPACTLNAPLLSLDKAGNMYANGSFTSSCDLDPSPGVYMPQATDNLYLYKLGSSGNFMWAESFYVPGLSPPLPTFLSIAADDAANTYVSGAYSGTMDIDPGPGVYTLSLQNFDGFIAVFDATGNFISAIQFQNTTSAMHVDGPGSIYAGKITSTDLVIEKYASLYTGLPKAQSNRNELLVFPNPGTGKYAFREGADLNDMEVSVYDQLGRQILNAPMPVSKQLDLSSFENGIYLVKLSRNGLPVYQSKLIKN